MTTCSWDIYTLGSGSRGETKTPKGTCKLDIDRKNRVDEAWCYAKNSATEYWDDEVSIPRAKQRACAWLNGPEVAKSKKQVEKEKDKKYRRLTRKKPSMGLLIPLALVGTVAAGYGIYKVTR